MIEPLEGRRLLAIVWANEFGVNDFDIYGNDEVYARDMVNRAMDDWDRVITDFNYDGDTNPNTTNSLNDTYTLTINAATLASPTTRAQTAIPNFDPNGLPTDTTITMDNDAAGNGWFFDSTPLDDAEFTGIANSFQASFVDSTAEGQSNRDDFYRTITHEIGHALGIFIGFGAIDQFQSLLGSFPSGESLFSFNNPNGQFDTEVTFTSSGGGHFFEGPPPSNLPNLPVHPNELMNPGRTVPPPGADPIPTTRQFISDLTVQVLADAYGYTVTLPSTLDTAHATLDELTGTLLVQGLPGAVNETITIDTVGEDIRVVVGNTTELFSQADVTQIVVAGNGGTDTITVASEYAAITQQVDYVVSSNEDAIDSGTLGDGLVDLDSAVPGNQTALRAAIQDANSAGAGAIYVPRGNYDLTLTGAGGTTQGDLDIAGDVTIVGAGAGLTVIDANLLGDRIFEVQNGGTLNASRLTLTGGDVGVGSGGAIFVNRGTLTLANAALVGNEAGTGGAIRVHGATGMATIERTVFTGNEATTAGGAIYAGENNMATLFIGSSVFANNVSPFFRNVRFEEGTNSSVSLGNNLTDDNPLSTFAGTNKRFFDAAFGDHIVLNGTVDRVVTNIVDRVDATDGGLSLREAVVAANSSNDVIWVPAWRYRLDRTGVEASNAAFNDLDITGDVTIVGAGAGLTVIDASGLGGDGVGGDDRVFELRPSSSLDLSRLTLTGGDVGVGTGGAIFVNKGTLTLADAALVDNEADTGGAIRVHGATGEATIERSVFTGNKAIRFGGAIYAGDSANATLLIGSSVFATNTSPNYRNVRFDDGPNSAISLGNNLVDDNQADHGKQFFDLALGDVIDTTGTDYVVTSIADTFNQSDNNVALSLREAIGLANANDNVAEEIWLPAWNFVLTRDRATFGTGTTDMDVAFGDLDISDTLTIRGIDGTTGSQTKVQWRADVTDAVFDLLGDFTGNGIVSPDDGDVDFLDYLTWQQQTGSGTTGVTFEQFSADADDDGDVDSDDLSIMWANFGNTLSLFNIVA